MGGRRGEGAYLKGNEERGHTSKGAEGKIDGTEREGKGIHDV